jgi:hypothetical protein
MPAFVKPPPLRAAVPGGFTLDNFEIDAEAGTITCPAGVTVHISKNRRARFANTVRTARCVVAARRRVPGE